MHIYLKTVFVKLCFALRVVMVYLHLFVLHAGAAIGAAATKLPVHVFSYYLAQRHLCGNIEKQREKNSCELT